MRRAILFRFHKEFEVCKNHIEIFRRYNPGIKIYGMYGGPLGGFKEACTLPLDNVWNIPTEDSEWKWRNGDLAAAWWFRKVGHTFDFDMLHQFAWDTLLLQDLDTYYAGIEGGVGMMNKQPLAGIYDSWAWVSGPKYRGEWEQLLNFVETHFDYDNEPLAGIFLGSVASRRFLDRYSRVTLPKDWCNDETRLPLFAQCFGMPIHDLGKVGEKCHGGFPSLTANEVIKGKEGGSLFFNPVCCVVNV